MLGPQLRAADGAVQSYSSHVALECGLIESGQWTVSRQMLLVGLLSRPGQEYCSHAGVPVSI